ncbi:MAG: hypothetical protein L0Y71_11085 [Gemmataceae bacterium]|nr:hypothetical protein [Gemmataceae bacterium]
MGEFKILCPACTSVLSSKKPIPNGKRITCPHCHKPFVAATSEPASSSGTSSLDLDFTVPAPPGAAASRSGDRLGKHPAKKYPPKNGSHKVLLAFGIIGLLVLAVGGGAAGMYYYMMAPETPVARQAKGQGKSQGKGGTSGDKSADTRKGKGGKARDNTALANNDGKEDRTNLVKADTPQPARPRVQKPAKPAEWKEFKSPKGGFAVMFPGAPRQLMEREEDVIFYAAKAEAAGAEYDITFHRLKKDEVKLPVKDRLDAIADQYKASIEERKEIELSGQPALELRLLLGEKKLLAFERWVVYKEHVFHISVAGDKEKLGPDQVTQFLDSFRFVGDPQGEFVDITKATNIPEKK